jgi:hypothetical protein
MKMRIALPLGLAALPLLLIARRGADAEPDAVSAASLSVSVANITATAATINYFNDKYNYGTRTLCYDPAPATPTHNCTTKTASGNQGSFAVTGLTANTQYNFNIQAIDTRKGERPYATSGTFKTLATSALAPVLPGPGAIGKAERFDANGRRLDATGMCAGRNVIFTNRMAQPASR